MADTDMVHEEEQLASLNRHVVEITERIHEQERRIEHLEWAGGDAALARELLSLSLDLLSITQLHRSLTLARLGRSVPNKVN